MAPGSDSLTGLILQQKKGTKIVCESFGSRAWAAVLNPGFHLPAVFYCAGSSPGSREAVTVLQRKAINLCKLLKIHFSLLLFLSSKKGLVCL